MQSHDESIDIAKGIGIFFVVVGHVNETWVKDAVFLWHMPLFFLLSGLVFKSGRSWLDVAKKRAATLLVPYFAYLVVLAIPQLILAQKRGGSSEVINLANDLIFGGREMAGWFGVFWFATCLYVTQVAAAAAIERWRGWQLVLFGAVCLCLAYLLAQTMPALSVPGNAVIALFALPLFLLGHWYGMRRGNVQFPSWMLRAVALLLIAAAALGYLRAMDMKQMDYGTPVVSLAAALLVCGAVLSLARGLINTSFGRMLSLLGSASLVVMFTHQAIQLSLLRALHVQSEVLRVLAALGIGVLLFFALRSNRLTSRLFLGQAGARNPAVN